MRLLSASRVILAILIAAWVPLAQRGAFRLEFSNDGNFLRTALIYFFLSLVFWAINRWRKEPFVGQLLTTTLVDIVALGLLLHFVGGIRASFALLLLAPVAAASVLATRLQAMFFAAAVSLVLLIEASYVFLADDTADVSSFVQAGFIGGAAFISAFAINRLARRLEQQETIVFQRDVDLREQLTINERIIAQLQEGVVILDDAGSPRAMNGAAERLLGGSIARLPPLEPGAAAIPWLTAMGDDANGRAVLLRAIETAIPGRAGVVFVQDQAEVESRAQELKLASMGRLSASIAHEIRNPLSAIRHANSLISEQVASLPNPVLVRLADMIESNTVRINRIIEDVLSLARRAKNGAAAEPLQEQNVGLFLTEWLSEYADQENFDQTLVQLDVRTAALLPFDPNHLRQVLVNLVGNARRYCTGTPGSVRLMWIQAGASPAELRVIDDGAGLSANQRQHLFEPFYSSESSGVGLGLFLARELCAANNTSLSYERVEDKSDAKNDDRLHQDAFIIRTL